MEKDTEDIEIVPEAISYICNHCGGDQWNISIVHTTDGHTLLLIACADPECVSALKERLQIEEDSEGNRYTVGWGTFEITGQGYDIEDLEKEKPFRSLN